MATPSDTNMVSFRNIEETDQGSYVSMLELIVTLRCLLNFVVCVQSWTPE